MISSKTIGYISIRNYSTTISKKKILICGNDITGLSLALFLKKKGISSEVIESGVTSKNDTGIVLTNNSYKAFQGNGCENVANQILNNSIQLNGIGYFSKRGAPFGFLNFLSKFKNVEPSNSIVYSIAESKIKEILNSQFRGNHKGEGTVSIKKGIKIRKILEANSSNQQQQPDKNDSGVYITFSNSELKVHYDLVIGSANCYESQDLIREYLSDKLEKSVDGPLYGSDASSVHYFSTIVNNYPNLAPPLITTQFQRHKKFTSFKLPNQKIAISGSFLKKNLRLLQQQQQNPGSNNNADFKNIVSNEFCIFEDLGAHNLVSLQDNQNDLPLGDASEYKFNSYAHNSLCLIGDAADKLPQDNLFGTVIGIEDAQRLVEVLTKDTNGSDINIPQQLQEFNKDRQVRMNQHMKFFMNDKSLVFDTPFLSLLLGKLYYKMVYSSKNQFNRLKQLISN